MINEEALSSSALFLDEIKNKNFNIRVFKVKKLISLCELLPIERITNELVPLVIDIIYNFENSPEVLCEYAKSIEKIILYLLENAEQITSQIMVAIADLIQSYYDKLIPNEDDIVQSDSLQCIDDLIAYSVSDSKNSQQLKNIIMQTIDVFKDNNNKLLSQYGFLLSMSFVVPKLFIVIESDTERLSLFGQSLIYLSSFKTVDNFRRFTIQNISKVLPEINNETVLSVIGDIISSLLTDQNEFVVINDIEAATLFIKRFPNLPLSQNLLNSIVNQLVIAPTAMMISWRIKQSVIDFIYSSFELISNAYIENVFCKFIMFSLDESANAIEPQIKISIISHIDYFVDRKLSNFVVNDILPILKNIIVNNTCLYVRKAVAEVMPKVITKLCNSEIIGGTTNSKIGDIVNSLLSDEMCVVPYTFVESVKIDKKNLDLYTPVIYSILKEPYWRLRYEIAKKINEYIELYVIEEKKDIAGNVLNFIKILFNDKANDIRLLCLDIIKKIIVSRKENGSYHSLLDEVYKIQEDILNSKQSKYTMKIYAMNSFKELYQYYSEEQVCSLKELLESLRKSSIENIKRVSMEILQYINTTKM